MGDGRNIGKYSNYNILTHLNTIHHVCNKLRGRGRTRTDNIKGIYTVNIRKSNF